MSACQKSASRAREPTAWSSPSGFFQFGLTTTKVHKRGKLAVVKRLYQTQPDHLVMLPADASDQGIPAPDLYLDNVLYGKAVRINVAYSTAFKRNFDKQAVDNFIASAAELDSSADPKSLVRPNGQDRHLACPPVNYRSTLGRIG